MKNKFKLDGLLLGAIVIAMAAAFGIAGVFYLIHLTFGFGGVYTVTWVLLIPIIRACIGIWVDAGCLDIDDFMDEIMENDYGEDEEVSVRTALDD